MPAFSRDFGKQGRRRDSRQDKTINSGFSFSSAACGSDILFAEAMLEAGGEVTIVLPYEFRRVSSWRRRFDEVNESSGL